MASASFSWPNSKAVRNCASNVPRWRPISRTASTTPDTEELSRSVSGCNSSDGSRLPGLDLRIDLGREFAPESGAVLLCCKKTLHDPHQRESDVWVEGNKEEHHRLRYLVSAIRCPSTSIRSIGVIRHHISILLFERSQNQAAKHAMLRKPCPEPITNIAHIKFRTNQSCAASK